MPIEMTREEFRARATQSDGYIDIGALDERAKGVLEGLGITDRDLRRVAGSDGKIATENELNALFKLIDDRFDENGDELSIALVDPGTDGSTPQISDAARAVYALHSARRTTHTTTLPAFRERFLPGQIHVDQLTEAQTARLAELGFRMDKFEDLVGEHGSIQGKHSLDKLFLEVDWLDSNRNPNSFEAAKDVLRPGASIEGHRSLAGEALAIIESVWEPYDQPFRQYVDRSRALKDESVTEIEIRNADGETLKHIAQGSRQCGIVVWETIGGFDNNALRNLLGPEESFYMTLAEDGEGAIAGSRELFTAGRQYVDRLLEAGRPVMVGVSYKLNTINEGHTDHFLTIFKRGVDEDGRVYYEYRDPATSGEYKTGRLYVDRDTNLLFKPPFDSSHQMHGNDYQVTQVRPYADIPRTPAEY